MGFVALVLGLAGVLFYIGRADRSPDVTDTSRASTGTDVVAAEAGSAVSLPTATDGNPPLTKDPDDTGKQGGSSAAAIPPLNLSGRFYAVHKGQFELYLNGTRVELSNLRSDIQEVKPDDIVAVRINSTGNGPRTTDNGPNA